MNNQKSMINDMTTGSVTKQLLIFALPLMLSNVLQTIYNVVDMIVIGHFVGSAGLSAVSNGGEIVHLCTAVGMGFGTAGQILIAQYVGAGDRKSISDTIGNMTSFMLSMSLVLTAITLIFMNPMLKLLNIPDAAYSETWDYTVVCCCGLFFIFGYNIVSSILRGMGDSKRPLLFIGIATVVNIVLDLLFVAVWHMDAFGAALATVIGQGVSFIVSVIYLYIKREQFGFDFQLRSFAIKKNILKPLIKLGVPLSLQQAAISISMLVVKSFINAYGVVISAVTAVGDKLRNIVGLVTFALGTAASSMIAQNVGAGKHDRVKIIMRTTVIIALSAATIISVIFLLLPVPIFSLFNTDPEVLAWAPKHMIVVAITLYSFALMSTYNALVNGVGNAKLGLIIGLLDGVVSRVAFALFLGEAMGFGIMGLWIGNALAPLTTAAIGAAYFYTGKWKNRKLIS